MGLNQPVTLFALGAGVLKVQEPGILYAFVHLRQHFLQVGGTALRCDIDNEGIGVASIGLLFIGRYEGGKFSLLSPLGEGGFWLFWVIRI